MSGYMPNPDDESDDYDPRGDLPRSPFPDQPVVLDEHGVARFQANRVIGKLMSVAVEAGYSLNGLASDRAHGVFTDAECAQLMQLVGYSVSGFGDLSYVNYDDLVRADAAVEELLKDPVTKLGDTVRA